MVLPELIELSRDEGSSVRLAAFETLVNLLDIFDTGKSSCGHIFASESIVFPCFVSLVRSKGSCRMEFLMLTFMINVRLPFFSLGYGPFSFGAFSAATFPLLAPGVVEYFLPFSFLSSTFN